VQLTELHSDWFEFGYEESQIDLKMFPAKDAKAQRENMMRDQPLRLCVFAGGKTRSSINLVEAHQSD
jgi:hypothetical protein